MTGADGFIGSHLVENLVEKGADVRAFVYYNAFNSWGWLDAFPKNDLKNIDVFCGDIRDPNGVNEAVKGVDIIFHLAALIGIPFSYHSPDSYVDTNVKGTLNILQSARRYNAHRVIHTSTSEVYGTAQYVPMDEKHPVRPQSPYAASKLAADELALSFYRSFDLPVTILRPFNTFGPRQSARAVIPTIISQICSGKQSIVLGDMETTRDFNFVGNTVDAFIAVAESDKVLGEVMNTGSRQQVSIRELVDLIVDIVGKKVKIRQDRRRFRPSKSEVKTLCCDAGKIKRLCGWEPRVDLRRGLKITYRWFLTHWEKYKTEIYNI